MEEGDHGLDGKLELAVFRAIDRDQGVVKHLFGEASWKDGPNRLDHAADVAALVRISGRHVDDREAHVGAGLMDVGQRVSSKLAQLLSPRAYPVAQQGGKEVTPAGQRRKGRSGWMAPRGAPGPWAAADS